jgi:hypothetical protein
MPSSEATFDEETNLPAIPSHVGGAGTKGAVGRPLILTALVLTMLFLSCAFLAVQTTGVQHYVVKSWLEQLELHCSVRLKIREFSWDWPRTLTLVGVEMDVYGKRLMECEEAAVSFSLSGVSPFWYVKELALDHPVFYLEKDSGGHWLTPSPGKIEAGTEGQSCGLAGPSSTPILIRLNRGTVAAEQDGRQILKVGNVSGQLTLHHDGGVGVGSLLANLERLQPSPRAFNRHEDGSETGNQLKNLER